MVIVVFVDRLIKMTHFAAVMYSSNGEDYSAAVYQSAWTKVSCASAYICNIPGYHVAARHLDT